ncbi:MAG TPA: RagB/SusD family nutrient uptake outer membrane protein [Bacteroidales bacterium]|nr:RagB/SusD family nutrient uptake outer membrane protein [Bacteroidales bacterium]
MKRMKYPFLKSLLLIVLTVTTASCDQYLQLYPEDDIVDEEYWQTGDQVQSVVASCYRFMIDNDVINRMIYWGEIRSDNVDYSSASTDEKYLKDANLLSSSGLVTWDKFYKVINVCNKVILKAPGVCDLDANFNQTTMHHYLAEAYTLRALCYFYLVRSFGDVPYVTIPSESERQDYLLFQTKGDSIITKLIDDMENIALPYAAVDWPTEAYTHGRITRNAVRVLLADLYLWKASNVTNPTADTDYQASINYCDAILTDNESTLIMAETDKMYRSVFYTGNDPESIFELNFEDKGLANNSTATLYGNTVKSKTPHFIPTKSLYDLYSLNDQRAYTFMQVGYTTSGTVTSPTSYKIFKYEGQTPSSGYGLNDYTYRSSTSNANWILYRLPDVYLIKAEALVELSKNTGNGSLVSQAVSLCNITYKRSTNNVDSLILTDNSKAEEMVLNERRREFCFEGKRWFDLLRKVRRDGSTTDAFAYLSDAYEQELSTYKARLSSMDAWFIPISKTEINVNPNLRQNAYYSLKEQ